MCLTVTLKVFGTTLFFQGCVNVEPVAFPQKVEPPPPAIITEDWAPMIAKADPDDDGSVTYFFRDTGGRVRPAIANCGDATPKEEEGRVMITRVENKNLTVYTVACKEPAKIM